MSIIEQLVQSVTKLNEVVLQLQMSGHWLAHDIAKQTNCKLITIQEYDHLVEISNNQKSKVDAEVKEKVALEVTSLNSELKHQVEKSKLTSAVETADIRSKLTYLEHRLQDAQLTDIGTPAVTDASNQV